jgi:hypothetical protein
MMNSLRKYKVLLNGIDGSMVGEKMCKRSQEVGSLNRKKQEVSSLGIHLTRTNDESTRAFGYADKVAGICKI